MSNHIQDRTLASKLSAVFAADRALRTAEMTFLDGPADRQLATLAAATDEALALKDDEERAIRLMRIADLLGEFQGPDVMKLLLRILDHDEPSVRDAAGVTLIDQGYANFAQLASALEEQIVDGTSIRALREVPFILAEIGERAGVKLCISLLKHGSGDVAASAVEALAMFGDPSVIRQLEGLRGDPRQVGLEESDGGDEGTSEYPTVGEIAREAIEHLRDLRASASATPAL